MKKDVEFARTAAMLAMDRQLWPETIDIKDISDIYVDEIRRDVVISFCSRPPLRCSTAFDINNNLVAIDKARGAIYTGVDCTEEVNKLRNALAIKIALAAFYDRKEVIFDAGLHNLRMSPSEAQEMLEARFQEGSPYVTHRGKGQIVDSVQSITSVKFPQCAGIILNTPTQVVVSSPSLIAEKYEELMYAKDASLDKPTKLDKIMEEVKSSLPENANAYDISVAFEAKIIAMYHEDPQAVKEMLAEAVYNKKLTPVLISGFDTKMSYYDINVPEANISIVSEEQKSMTTGQPFVSPDHTESKFAHSMFVVNEGSTLVCAIAYGDHTYMTENQPRLFSSIDFSEELYKLRREQAVDILVGWQMETPDWAIEAVQDNFSFTIDTNIEVQSQSINTPEIGRD